MVAAASMSPRADPQNAVVGPAREPAEEEERESPQARGQAGQASGEEGLQHGEPFLPRSEHRCGFRVCCGSDACLPRFGVELGRTKSRSR